jgi:hypothetical protein
MRFSGFVLSALALLAGCDGTISVTFVTGPQEVQIASTALALPVELDDGSGRIATFACGPMGMCPPNDALPLSCEADACDPAPVTLSGPVGDVIDVSALLAEARGLGIRRVESYEVEEIAFDVPLNTLTLGVGPVELFWGPESATAIDPSQGVRRFGTVPRIEAGTSPTGQVQIDEEGAAALGRYLVGTAARVRFFALTSVDLEPGDPFPAGALTLRANATITAVGRVVGG